MTSGGLSKAEGWNLQLQGRVRDLEADLAEAELRLDDLLKSGAPACARARAFLRQMEAKRQRAKEQADEIDQLLSEG